jgi:NADPH:quinone reductase-like Zn-dependent oxidoreductase
VVGGGGARDAGLRTTRLASLTSTRRHFFAVARLLLAAPAGSFRPVIDAEFALADIQAGHEYMESNASTGKIVVAVQPEL